MRRFPVILIGFMSQYIWKKEIVKILWITLKHILFSDIPLGLTAVPEPSQTEGFKSRLKRRKATLLNIIIVKIVLSKVVLKLFSVRPMNLCIFIESKKMLLFYVFLV